MLQPQLQPEHLGEQRVVPVPPGPDRLDERVRAHQRRQDSPGPRIAGQVHGGIGFTCSRMLVLSSNSRTAAARR
jgi:hypothetical protein